MKEPDFKDLFLTQKSYDDWVVGLEKKVAGFSYSYMSNSKWQKLLLVICKNKEIFRHCEIYDFFSPGINEIIFCKIDNKYANYIYSTYLDNYFTTSEHKTAYKEVEYIEFLKYWEGEYIGKLVKAEVMTQDTELIKETVSKIGQFEWEETEKYLRIIAYR